MNAADQIRYSSLLNGRILDRRILWTKFVVVFLLLVITLSYTICVALGLTAITPIIQSGSARLYQESETREIRSLDGIWNFVKSEQFAPTQGIADMWYKNDLSKVKKTIPMPVPASYNDITVDAELRDHVGSVWYDRRFFVPKRWKNNQKVWIRFGSVHYSAIVWINGIQVVEHEIGHLPFEADITQTLKFGEENRITVFCDNRLTATTVPQGKTVDRPTDHGVVVTQDYSFDFFNYAGIHRSVFVYTTPQVFISDVAVKTDLIDGTGIVHYKVTIGGHLHATTHIGVKLFDKFSNEVASNHPKFDRQGTLTIENVKPWWPYLMHPEPGYLYTVQVSVANEKEEIIDIFRLKIGIRSLKWDEGSVSINGQPIYLRGFGKHEDSDIKGKGLDLALLTKDFNLIKWIGANAYRTSHYPYSEESMQFADDHGIMIIDECPSVNTEYFSQDLLANHKSALEQLIQRDKNHPSVIMWSIANEPSASDFGAGRYFENVANFAKSLDQSRPITAAIAATPFNDEIAYYLDVVSFNRYNAWYSNNGRLDMIVSNMIGEAKSWHEKYKKPVLVTEYGADAIVGFHSLPDISWTEDYQATLLSQHFRAFDTLRKTGWFIGEFVWNFADFQTAQSYTRVAGNKKGLFTRNREPKAAAHILRQRYFGLCEEEWENCTTPTDLLPYVIGKYNHWHEDSEL